MPLVRLCRFVPASVCLSVLITGCASTKGTAPSLTGTFTNGGSGQYGQSAADANAPTATETVSIFGLFSGKPTPPKVGPKTRLAYAQWEERQGNYAAARNQPEEQRAAHAAARKSYEQVLAADSKSVDAVIGLARLDAVAGRTNDAEQGFLKAVKMDSASAHSLDALGQFYCDHKRFTEAIPTLQKAMTSAPDDQSIRYHYAIAMARSGQIDEAQPHLVQAVGSASAHYNLGLILHERGDLAGCEDHLVAAILENPRLQEAQHWLQDVRRERQKATPQLAQRNLNGSTIGTPPADASRGTAPAVTPAGSPRGAGHAPPRQAASTPSVIQQASATSIDEPPSDQAASSIPVLPLVRQAVHSEDASGEQWDNLQ